MNFCSLKKPRVRPIFHPRKMLFCSEINCLSCCTSGPRIGDGLENGFNSPFQLVHETMEGTCDIRDSPFRILRVAEAGNVKDFTRIITGDPTKLDVRDGRGRAPVHQATVRNHVSILEVVVSFNGSLDLTDSLLNTPLHLAVEVEALKALDFLLANGADTRALNSRNQSPLHLACELNKIESLKILAKYRDHLDTCQGGEHGRTALHLAAISDNEECMRILLYDIGACPRKKDKHGFFPIHEAAKHASSRSMEILLSWGESNGCTREEMIAFYDSEGNVPLHSAVHGGDIRAVELCLRSGAKISTQQYDLSTPIHLACSQGSMEIVKLMFTLQPEEKDTCLKSCDLQRMTPLHCAAMFDHYELVEYLVSQGASINVLDKERRSPLHLAASRNGWRSMSVLVRLGANIFLKDNDQRNVLHISVIHGGELEKILEGDTCGEITSILEETDKYGFTPLHYAAKQGHIKTSSMLLKLGANIIAKNNEGENVFHIACRYGRVNIIRQILIIRGNNSVINEGNGKGETPLHLAAQEGQLRVVQVLMKKGALLHRDHLGRTPLHLAAKNGHRETMRLILNVHSHLLDQIDKDGNTSLHMSAMENKPSACEVLLTLHCKLLYNFKGFSAIDYALQSKFIGVALAMVTHKTRGEEILAMTSGKHSSIMLSLVATMPSVVSSVLDRCIVKSTSKSDSESFNIKYQFKWLSVVSEPMIDEGKSNILIEKEDLISLSDMKHLPILNGMVSYGRVELLSHDLSQKYLQMKWNAYGKYVHMAHLILYSFYLFLLTCYASSDSLIQDNLPNPIMNSTILYDKSENVIYEQIINCFALFIMIIATFNLVREFINVHLQGFNYLCDSVNWVFFAMNISSMLMVFKRIYPSWNGDIVVNPAASLTAFLSWFYLLLLLQRFDVVGIYVVMFLEILHTLLRVLAIFSILIVAFGLAFYILLSGGNHISFRGVPLSLLRTFSMMLGDLDFLNTFVNPDYCSRMSHLEPHFRPREICSPERNIPHPIPSFLLLCIFMVFMPILLMNLLIGLAVGDIESVRRNAQLKRLAMQVHLHTHLEKTLPNFIINKVDKDELIEYPNARNKRLGLITRFFNYFQPKDFKVNDDDKEEDECNEILEAIQENNGSLQSVSNHLENVEALMRLICHKLELSTDTDYIDEGTEIEEWNPMSDIKSHFKRGPTVRLSKRSPRPPKRSDSTL